MSWTTGNRPDLWQQPLITGLEAIYPNRCTFCGRVCEERKRYPGICRTCLPLLPFRPARLSRLNWRDLDESDPGDGTAVYCATWYADPIRKALLRFKFSDAPDIAASLASILLQCWQSCGKDCLAVAAVPLHKDRFRERGYNQAGLLAQQLANCLDRPDWSGMLVRRRATERQSGQNSYTERRLNIADAFGLNERGYFAEAMGTKPQTRLPILLVDDILTTGATLSEAARPLRQLGFSVNGLVVSSDHRSSPEI